MQREDFLSLLIYFLMGALVIVVGVLVFRPAAADGYLFNDAWQNFLFLLVSLVIAIVFNIFALQIGHLIGAKMGGYRILSISFFGFIFYKVKTEEGNLKTKVRFGRSNSFGGQVEMAPKSLQSNPMPYIFVPFVLLLLQLVALYFVFAFIKSVTDDDKVMLMAVKYGVVVLATIGACFIIYNFFPAKLDTLNDGYKIVLLNKKINIEAYNYGLMNDEIEYFGGEIKEIRTFDQITDFTARVNLKASIQEIINDNYQKAEEIINFNMSEAKKMSNSTYRKFLLLNSYFVYLTKSEEEALTYYQEKIIKADLGDGVRNCKTYDSLRLYVAYVGITEKSINEIKFALEKKKKRDKNEDRGEIEKQNKLLKKIIDKIALELPEAAEIEI